MRPPPTRRVRFPAPEWQKSPEEELIFAVAHSMPCPALVFCFVHADRPDYCTISKIGRLTIGRQQRVDSIAGHHTDR